MVRLAALGQLVACLAVPLLTKAMPLRVGDCNGDGIITVSEVVRCVNIVLGSADSATCPAFVCDRPGLEVACLQTVVDALLTGPTVVCSSDCVP